MRVDDRALPVGEHDRAVVLPPGTRLGEDLVPVVPVRLDDDRARALDREHRDPFSRDRQLHSGRGLLDDLRVDPVEGDHESLGPLMPDDASVAQVQAEQIRVGPGVGWSP
jgi:hypothetical protein